MKDTHIYFPEALYDALKAEAKADRRTISAVVVMATETYLKAQKTRRSKVKK
jgi:hypothetical protein